MRTLRCFIGSVATEADRIDVGPHVQRLSTARSNDEAPQRPHGRPNLASRRPRRELKGQRISDSFGRCSVAW